MHDCLTKQKKRRLQLNTKAHAKKKDNYLLFGIHIIILFVDNTPDADNQRGKAVYNYKCIGTRLISLWHTRYKLILSTIQSSYSPHSQNMLQIEPIGVINKQ